MPARIWELLIGALVAIVLISGYEKRPHLALKETCAGLGLFLIAYSVFTFDSSTPFPGFFALAPTVGTALIIVFGEKDTYIGRLLSLKVLVGIGLISYSAYLWHHPIFALARYQGLQIQSSSISTLLLVVTFILAFLSWRYIETPFRVHRSVNRQTFVLGATFSVLFIAVGLVIYVSNGLESRFKTRLIGDVGQLEFHQYLDDKYFDCEPKSVAAEALSWEGYLRCKQSKKGVADVVLLGDSHAEHLFIGLAEAEPALNIAFYILNGMPLIENNDFRVIFDELLKNGESQHVLMTFDYRSRILIDSQNDVLEGLELTIEKLRQSSKVVSLLGKIPSFSVNAEMCKFRHRKTDNLALCYLSVNQATDQSREFVTRVKHLSNEQDIAFFEIYQALCNETDCGMIKDRRILYRDDNHLNILGSKLVGGYLSNLMDL